MTQQEEQEIDKKCDEFCEYRRTHSNGYAPREWFMAGAKALDDLRKPSERPNIKDYFAATETLGAIHNEIVEAPRLYAYMQALDAYIDNLEEKTSEPESNVCEAMENVSKQAIIARLKRIGFTRMDEPNHYANDLGLSFAFDQNSKYSIANSNGDILISTDDVFDAFKLLQPDNELLEEMYEALIIARDRIGVSTGYPREIAIAISNYEKQSK